MALAVGIFALALAAIASERVHRTKVALVGAGLMLVTQTIDQEEAIAAIDFNTIGLLAGMMLVVRLTETTGVYNYVAIRAGQLARGRPLGVVIALSATTAVLSAFLDNLTTILLMVPITFLLADALDVDPIPIVIIEIIASNIGGTATLIGDPPNILIAGATGLSFMSFIANLAPAALVTFAALTGWVGLTLLFSELRWFSRRPLADRLSLGVAARLSRYLQVLTQARKMGKETISSQELSEYTHVNSTQIRRDLSGFGKFGKRGVGYNVDSLVSQIRKILRTTGKHNIALFGAGHLGRAIASEMRPVSRRRCCSKKA
jgi:Na+/H+ antiporter NhaB